MDRCSEILSDSTTICLTPTDGGPAEADHESDDHGDHPRDPVLVQDTSGDLLLARLPPLPCVSHPRALPSLMEALALWCGTKVSVVLYVDEQFSWEATGLSDTLGFGIDTLFCEVEIVPLEPRRRGAKRLTGLGSFARERSARRRTG